MAGFHTHITVSTALGAGMAWLGHEHYHLGWSACAVAGGLCSVGGMMPDLDSDSGVPARETIGFAAAVVPMLLSTRLQQQYGFDVESLFLFGAPIYLFIRFGLGTLFKIFTVHRGMFHSLPAAAIAGMVVYLLCDHGVSFVRVFKACGMVVGFLSHLLLDEIWSIQVRNGTARVKNSFGTAMKFFGQSAPANAMCYATLILLGLAVLQEQPMPKSMPVATPQPAFDAPEFEPPRTVIVPPERRPGYDGL